MYRRFVVSKAEKTWAGIDAHDPSLLFAGLADGFSHTFLGDHAMGGTRTSVAKMSVWFERVFRFFPDIHFKLRSVAVSGMPWDTVVLTWVDVTVPVDGEIFRNTIAQRVEIKWGKVHNVINLEDTQLLAKLLDRLASRGMTEAHEAPITGG
jgi:ketosteroid isomerase-like protein